MKADELEPYLPDHASHQLPLSSRLWGKWIMMKSIPKIIPFRSSVSDPWLVEVRTPISHCEGVTNFVSLLQTFVKNMGIPELL